VILVTLPVLILLFSRRAVTAETSVYRADPATH